MNATRDAMLAFVRALHIGAAILLFGQFAFMAFVSRSRRTPPGFAAVAGTSLGVALAMAFFWLALEARNMSGLPLREALRAGTLSIVLGETPYGRVWLFRMFAAIVLVVVPGATRRAGMHRLALPALGGV